MLGIFAELLGIFAEPLFPHIRIRKLPAPDVSLGKYLYQRVYTQQRLHFCGVQLTNMLLTPANEFLEYKTYTNSFKVSGC